MLQNMRRYGLAGCYALTVFVSAFLLFQVQPVMSKTILPWFGGAPAVWTTCLLFFQVLLFFGYTYAHLLTRTVRPGLQGLIHLGVIVAALLLLPITMGPEWKPADNSHPTLRILLLLGANVGVPYFLLSSTGPLVQAWFARTYLGRSPYRLYCALQRRFAPGPVELSVSRGTVPHHADAGRLLVARFLRVRPDLRLSCGAAVAVGTAD